MPNTADDLDPVLLLSQRRYIELVRRLHGDGWSQTRIARALSVSQSYISQILRGRGPAVTLQRIEDAISGLPIERAFFEDPDVNERDYQSYMGKRPRRTASGEVPAASGQEPSEGWQKFVRLGLDRVYMQRGLTAGDLEWVRRAPGRKGLKNLDFYVDLCEAVLKGVDPHPEFTALGDEPTTEGRNLIHQRRDQNGDLD